MKSPDSQGRPCTPILWTHIKPSAASIIRGCKNQALKGRATWQLFTQL